MFRPHLHPRSRYAPRRAIQIKLAPLRLAQLTGPDESQRRQTHRATNSYQRALISIDRGALMRLPAWLRSTPHDIFLAQAVRRRASQPKGYAAPVPWRSHTGRFGRRLDGSDGVNGSPERAALFHWRKTVSISTAVISPTGRPPSQGNTSRSKRRTTVFAWLGAQSPKTSLTTPAPQPQRSQRRAVLRQLSRPCAQRRDRHLPRSASAPGSAALAPAANRPRGTSQAQAAAPYPQSDT